jgi:hypothetical protein
VAALVGRLHVGEKVRAAGGPQEAKMRSRTAGLPELRDLRRILL